jgi:hypothetical protein
LVGQSPVGIAVADVRKIGILDLIVAEADSNSVGILLGNGDGTFGPETDYYVPGPALSVAVADFNGDNTLDLVVGIVSFDSFGASIGPVAFLAGNGAGSFGVPILSPNQSYFPSGFITISVVSADLNGDGLPDLVLVGLAVDSFTNGVVVYLNEGNGTFKPAQQVAEFVNGLNLFEAAAVGDINEDGCPDIVAPETGAGAVFVFWGNCNGTFQNTATILRQGAGDNIVSLALADLNGDGHLDVVTAGAYFGEAGLFGQVAGNLVSVMLGDGHGNFGTAHVFRGERSMWGLAVADLNNDGKPDIVTANQDTDTASIYVNDGQGNFDAPTGAYIGYPPPVVFNAPHTNFFVRDINGDGRPDLALFEFPVGPLTQPWEFTVLLNNGTGKFGTPVRSPAAEGTYGLIDAVLGDFRNTSRPDLLVLESDGQRAAFVFSANQGGGTFGATKTIALTTGSFGKMAVGDFDGDGKLDVAIVAPSSIYLGSPILTIFHGNGDGTFTPGYTTPFTDGPLSDFGSGLCFAADVNHDGKVDLLVLPGLGLSLYEFLGNGDGTFAPAKVVFTNTPSFNLADLNHDGFPDLVTAYNPASDFGVLGPNNFSIYLGQPDGSFKFLQSYEPYGQNGLAARPFCRPDDPFQCTFPMFADFNGDGNLDIATFQHETASIIDTAVYFQVLLGNGDGTFTPTYATFPLEKLSVPGLAADLDGDGRADMIELDGLTASYHIIPGAPGPALQLALPSTPVVGQQGALEILLSLPSNTPTDVQLSASDPNIQIPATFTIPTGSLTAQVPFTIAPTYDSSRVFTLTAQLGTQTATISSFQTSRSLARFQFIPTFATETTPPGGVTHDYEPQIVSIGGYSTTVQFSCQGLPVGATCEFSSAAVYLPAGQLIFSGLMIHTSSNTPIGSYSIQLIATDGFVTDQLAVVLNVADFGVSASPTSVNVLRGISSNLSLTIGALGPWTEAVTISCQASPGNSIGCSQTQSGYVPGTYPTALSILANTGTPAGDYAISIAGWAEGVTHNAPPVTIHIAGPPATNTTLSSSANPSIAGQSVIFTATLVSSVGTPTGTVNFLDGIVQVGSGTLNANGQASFTTGTLAPGLHSITASYAGNTTFAASISSPLTQAVMKPSATSLVSSLNPSVSGQPVTFTATVTSSAGSTPTGTVTFSDGANSLGTCALNGSGVATFVTSSPLAVASHSITAIYGGDANYAASTSPAVTETVNAAGFAPSPTGLTVTAGQSLPINLTLYAVAGSGLNFTLSCVGVPSKTTCLFGSNPVAPGPPPNGTTVQLMLETSSSRLPAGPSNRGPSPWRMLGFPAALAALLAAGMIQSRKASRRRLAFGMCLAVFALASVLISCGGGGSNSSYTPTYTGTPKGSATFTVMGTSGTTTISTQVSVIVQ